MTKLINVIKTIENVLMTSFMILAVVIIFMQVILRYIFHSALPWAEEVSRYLFIYFTWIGTSAAISSDEHIRLDVLRGKLPRLGVLLEPLVSLVCLIMSIFMLTNGISLIQTMMIYSANSPTIKLPMWVFYMAIPFGGGLMTIKYLYKFIFEDIPAIKKGGEN